MTPSNKNSLQVKIGDFGQAARVEYDGERKLNMAEMPDFVAPEVLFNEGHSYEVDMWSLGCILYVLLVGQLPFETLTLKDTYARIRKYQSLSQMAQSFVSSLLLVSCGK